MLPMPAFTGARTYTLKAASGAAVSFASLTNFGCFTTVLAPAVALSPNTLYSLTVNPAPYIHSGYERIPSHWELRGADGLRIVPDQPLEPGRAYRLVLDQRAEFPLRLSEDHQPPIIQQAVFDGRTLRIGFDREISANPSRSLGPMERRSRISSISPPTAANSV